MNTYYTLTVSTETSKIGFYPQTEVANESEFFSAFSDFRPAINEIPDKIPKYKINLNNNAINTDIINRVGVSYGLVVSENLKKILELQNIPNHRFYSIDVVWKKKLLNYFWLHNYDNIFQYTDMDKSKFEIIQYKNVITHSFTSEDFYKSKNYECMMDFSKTFKITKIVFKDNFPNYDLFEFENRTLISQKVLDLFVENNITGYEATPYNIIEN